MSEKFKLNYNLILLITVGLGIVFFLWESPIVYPLKIFVVFLHELSHGLAAVLTGGSIVKIELSPNQGGICYTKGGWEFLVVTAGYLGSLLWGGMILLAAARTKLDRWISLFIGGVTLVVTVLFVRSGFGIIYGIGFGTALILLGLIMPGLVNDFVLKVIGLTSILYVIADIKDDLITRTVANSDASVLGKEFFGNSMFWGVIWIAIALVAAVFFLGASVKSGKDEES
jgi:hypothetical protein